MNMGRRERNFTDDAAASEVSLTDSIRSIWLRGENITFSNEEQRNAKPETILCRMLSTKSAISTDSSLAETNQRARDDAALQYYKVIGYGQCGTVYALTGTSLVVKLPNAAEKDDQLYTDFRMHRRVYNAFTAISDIHKIISIPKAKVWVAPESDHFWSHHSSLFDHGVIVPNFGLVSERIFPLPLPIRAAIVDLLAPKAIAAKKDEFLDMSNNKDCLIRLYLGRRNDNRRRNPETFTLRNFPLHADEMERIGIDAEKHALAMAQALAVLHWKVGIDANDVEFVLGSTPAMSGEPKDKELDKADKLEAGRLFNTDFQHRTLSLWLLDFNQCKNFKRDDASGIRQLVQGFWFNDPCYPRPNSKHESDRKLWDSFSTHYLRVSAALALNHAGPALFI